MTDPLAGLRPRRSQAVVPWWFERITFAASSAVLGFGLVGMVLALIGWFRIGPGLALGAALSYSLFSQWSGSQLRAPADVDPRPAAVVLAIALLSLLFNWTAAGEPLLTDSEPGVMVVAARHLDVSGSLTVEAAAGPFASARVGFVADGFGGSGVGGDLESEVPHLLPVLRGIGGWFGLTVLLGMGAVLGAIALLAFFWFTSRVVHPWIGVGLTAALAVSLPFVHAARSGYPELIALIGMFAGLSVLWDLAEPFNPWRAGIGGALLGVATLAEPEFAVVAIPVGIYVTLRLIESTTHSWLPGRGRRRAMLALSGGYAVPVLVAVADAARSGVGLSSTFELRRAGSVIIAAAVVFGVLRLTGRTVGDQPRFAYADIRRGFAFFVAGAVVVASGVALLRPATVAEEPSAAVAAVQELEGVPVEGTRTYDEDTGRWVFWYLGPLTAFLGVAGLAILIVEAVSDPERKTLPFLLIALVVSFAALVDAGPEPIQVFASSRILLTMAVVLIGAGVVGQRGYEMSADWMSPWGAGVIVGVALVVLVPLAHLSGVRDLSDHRGLRDGVDLVCETLQRRDVVLFAESGTTSPGATMAQTVRDFCRVPVARAADPSPDEIADLATAWLAEGRQLVVISGEPWPGLSGVQIDLEWTGLERTVQSRPNAAAFGGATLYLAPIG